MRRSVQNVNAKARQKGRGAVHIGPPAFAVTGRRVIHAGRVRAVPVNPAGQRIVEADQHDSRRPSLGRQIDRLKAERDEYREALRNVLSSEVIRLAPFSGYSEALSIAKEVLAKWEGKE